MLLSFVVFFFFFKTSKNTKFRRLKSMLLECKFYCKDTRVIQWKKSAVLHISKVGNMIFLPD